MNAISWLNESEQKLTTLGIQTARLDALILLEDVTQKDKAWLLAHPEFVLSQQQIDQLENNVQRRTKHEPLAYIRGKTEFYGYKFIVNEHTLEPRPETETMLELLENIDISDIQTIIDVGTGSGAIAVTAKILFPETHVYGTDIDNKCTQTAKTNAKKHDVSIDFFQGNLLEPLFDEDLKDWLILANLPYVPDSHTINQAAMFEPKHAIFGGPDGLDLYRTMFNQICDLKERYLEKPRYLLAESLPFQHTTLAEIAKNAGYIQHTEEDFIQVFTLAQIIQ